MDLPWICHLRSLLVENSSLNIFKHIISARPDWLYCGSAAHQPSQNLPQSSSWGPALHFSCVRSATSKSLNFLFLGFISFWWSSFPSSFQRKKGRWNFQKLSGLNIFFLSSPGSPESRVQNQWCSCRILKLCLPESFKLLLRRLMWYVFLLVLYDLFYNFVSVECLKSLTLLL